jgi:DNA processing protein
VFVVPGEITSALSAGSNALLRLGATPLLVVDDVLSALGVEPPDPVAREVSDDAQVALGCIRDGPTSPDELARATGLDAGRLAAALTELELSGLVSIHEGICRAAG